MKGSGTAELAFGFGLKGSFGFLRAAVCLLFSAIALARDCGTKNCIIATNVPYVYDKDPREYEDAKPMFDISFDDLEKITGTEKLIPGQSAVVDPIAVSLAKKSSIDIAVLDGRNISLLESALEGKEFDGTMIRGV